MLTLLGISQVLLVRVPMQFGRGWWGEEIAAYESRLFDVLALVSVMHLAILAGVGPRVSKLAWITAVPQAALLVFLYHARSSIGWQYLALFSLLAARVGWWAMQRFRATEPPRVAALGRPLFVAGLLAVSLVGLKQYQRAVYHPDYLQGYGQRTFWHNASWASRITGLREEPDGALRRSQRRRSRPRTDGSERSRTRPQPVELASGAQLARQPQPVRLGPLRGDGARALLRSVASDPTRWRSATVTTSRAISAARFGSRQATQDRCTRGLLRNTSRDYSSSHRRSSDSSSSRGATPSFESGAIAHASRRADSPFQPDPGNRFLPGNHDRRVLLPVERSTVGLVSVRVTRTLLRGVADRGSACPSISFHTPLRYRSSRVAVADRFAGVSQALLAWPPGPKVRPRVGAWVAWLAAMLASSPEWVDLLSGMLLLATATLAGFTLWTLVAWGFTVSMLLALDRAGRPLGRGWGLAYTRGKPLEAFTRDRLGVLFTLGLAEIRGADVAMTPVRGRAFARFAVALRVLFGLPR